MSQSTMRGMRLGAQSLEATSGIVFSERSDYTYICAKGHETVLTFAAEAELPPDMAVQGLLGSCNFARGRQVGNPRRNR